MANLFVFEFKNAFDIDALRMLKYDHYKNCGVFDLYLMFKLNVKCVLKYLKEDNIFFS